MGAERPNSEKEGVADCSDVDMYKPVKVSLQKN
jgi:hypothetical protein